MQIFKTCFLSSQNYLCIGEHTLCPFFKARFFWLQTIDMDAFDNNVVESYKMSKSIFCCNLSVEKYWSAGRSIPTNRKSRRSWRGNVPCSRSCRSDIEYCVYGPFYAGITAAVSCFVFNRRHRTEDTADTLVSLVV